MTVPTTLTYDLVPPRRPGLDDLQLAPKEDDLVYKPTDPAIPMADEFNQQAGQIAAGAKTGSVLIGTVHFAGGVASLSLVSVVSSNVPAFVLTRVGAGNTTLTWAAGSFPASIAGPLVSLNQDLDATICIFNITNGFQVKTRVGGTLTDADYAFSVR